ncbi:TPA: hypothetical protein ACI7BB_004742, partial [Escherichia coli]
RAYLYIIIAESPHGLAGMEGDWLYSDDRTVLPGFWHFGGFVPVLHVTTVRFLTRADAHYLPCSVRM